ncbi:hypothetical protein NP493_212g04015 [Ridgeia piscesae]|uniref:Uncharacterized protein n=1 Tax=Ridgeia piscesae TaxID=27915 RepID=A0AAD9UE96_RIDPI|nr:hypothetical protein NP493_212g04015 [Ridgeia piscesae]
MSFIPAWPVDRSQFVTLASSYLEHYTRTWYSCKATNQAGLSSWTSTSTPTRYLHCNRSSTSQPLCRVLYSRQQDNLTPVTLTSNPLICPTTTASLCINNARSVRNKTTDILDHIHEHDLDIVEITETWLTNQDSDLYVTRALTPPGYNLSHHPRCSRRGGGIAILHKESVKATSLKTFSNINSFEAMSLKLTLYLENV